VVGHHTDVRHDAALGLLDLHHVPVLGRLWELGAAKDLPLGLENADNLGRGLRDSLEHALFGLRDHPTPETSEARQSVQSTTDGAGQRSPHVATATHDFLGLSEHAARDGK
jgi:hypothetical protein